MQPPAPLRRPPASPVLAPTARPVAPNGGKHRRDERGRKSGFRADIEGMRGIAVLLVVLYHAGVSFFGGGYVGVDVFFVLSGFLITGLLVDELHRTGTVSLRDFYARRVRRLLPHATLVLAVTAVASYFVLSPLDRGGAARDIRAAALFFANWHFAAGSTNYMAGTDQSPVLHYWSLSVEEQFYVVWPLLLILLVGRNRLAYADWPRAIRRLVVALGVLGLGSFVVSALFTTASGAYGYFGVHTRAWELAAGGLLALGRPLARRIPWLVAALAGWAGLALVLWSSIGFTDRTVFPGVAAAVPVGGTMLLVLSGSRVRDAGAARLLSVRPLTYVGRISYGWYLWHWPVLALVRAHYGTQTDPTLGATTPGPSKLVTAGAVVVSFGLAALFSRVLETPIRTSRWLAAVRARSLGLGAALVATSVLGTIVVLQGTQQAPSQVASQISSAAAALPGAEKATPPPAPAPTVRAGVAPSQVWKNNAATPEAARKDFPKTYGCDVGIGGVNPPKPCLLGDPNGKISIALVGDSHASAWLPAFDLAGKANGWKVYFEAKDACSFIDVGVWRKQAGAYTSCPAWRTKATARLRSLGHLDAVVIARFGAYEKMILGPTGKPISQSKVVSAWRAATTRTVASLEPFASKVVILRDVPWPSTGDVAACLAKSPSKPQNCAFPRAAGVADAKLYSAERQVAAQDSRVRLIDLSHLICPTATCQVVTSDGVIKYRDTHHITASFSATLASGVAERLGPVFR